MDFLVQMPSVDLQHYCLGKPWHAELRKSLKHPQTTYIFPNLIPCLSAIASWTAMLSVMSANKIPWRRWCHRPPHSFHGQWESVWLFSRWWKCLLTTLIKEWPESVRQKAWSVHCCSHQHSTHKSGWVVRPSPCASKPRRKNHWRKTNSSKD